MRIHIKLESTSGEPNTHLRRGLYGLLIELGFKIDPLSLDNAVGHAAPESWRQLFGEWEQPTEEPVNKLLPYNHRGVRYRD